MLVSGLRRAAAVVLTLAAFLIAPAIMLAACFSVVMLVVFSQFLFLLPVVVVFAAPLVMGVRWMLIKPDVGAIEVPRVRSSGV